MLSYCVKDGRHQDAEEVFRLYLDALDEELPALFTSISHDKSATIVAPGVREREASQPGQTEVEGRGFTVRQSFCLCAGLRIINGCMVVIRPSQSSPPLFSYSVENPAQPYTRQTSPTLSLLRTGDHSISTSRSLSLSLSPFRLLIFLLTNIELLLKHNSVYTIEDALARISLLQPVQLGLSGIGEASQKVLIEELPLVLVLHLKRFLYDAAVDSIKKISKPIRFPPEFEMPLGTIFPFLLSRYLGLRILHRSAALEIMAPVAGKSAETVHYKLYGVLYHHGESAGSGHYTVDVVHPNGDSGSKEVWLHIDDEIVSVLRHEDVFLGHDNRRVDDRCAYMLFYCRTTPTQT